MLTRLAVRVRQSTVFANQPRQQQQYKRATRAMAGDEEQKAQEVAAAGGEASQEVTVFDKIVKGEIPSDVVYSDDRVLAFRDINPVASTHVVIIPKNRGSLSRLVHATEQEEEILGKLMHTAAKVARQEGLADDGYRIVINDGKHGCQVWLSFSFIFSFLHYITAACIHNP